MEEDASAARLVFHPEIDANAVSVESLLQVVRERSIVIDEGAPAAVGQALAEVKAAPQKREVVVSTEKPPLHGRDGELVWHAGKNPLELPIRDDAPDPFDRIDYYYQAHYITVGKGDVVGVMRAPVPGQDGADIFGKPKKARSPKPAPVKTDSSVSMMGDGQMIAQIEGILNFHSGFLKVIPLFEAAGSVDFSTGNIFFKGCVIIRGDVCDRFVVQSGQDITVMGVIGAATVICGRNLSTKCGMAAQDRGCLFVAGDATFGYVHNVHGVVNGSLVARREIINCDVAVGRNVICDAGALIGGTLAVGESVVVGALGSPKGTPTTLVFGSHPCRQQVEEMLKVGVTPPTPNEGGEAASAAQDSQMLRMVDQIRACADSSCEYVAGKAKPVNVTVQKFLHPGVIIKSGRTRVKIDRTLRGPIHISGDSTGGLVYRMGDGVSHPLSDLSGPLQRTG